MNLREMMSNEDELPLLTLKSINIEEFIDDMSRQILDEIRQNKYILEKQLDILIENMVISFVLFDVCIIVTNPF